MVYFGIEDETKTHRLYDPQHKKFCVSRDVVFKEEKKWDWCSVCDSKQTVTKFATLEEEEDTTNLESFPTATPTSRHMSSSVTLKCVMDSLEQQSSSGSTIEDGPNMFCSLAEIYVDTLEQELDPDELGLLAAEEPKIYHEAGTEMMWHDAMQK